MKAARLLPPLLAGATLVLICANALPTAQRRHRLLENRERLTRELNAEGERSERLQAEVDALRHDTFYLERVFVETWKVRPQGARPFEPHRRSE